MKRLSNDFLLEMFNMNNDPVWSPSADIYETEHFVVINLKLRD